ncbi:hypothetical protein [Burkholderia vietnamiensis]|uniref:hypothetical protein n=1 Tax=Burkholderia vietnamiensis TaxID=60552 RepID=UPI000D9FBF5D|nr:hypothetical protein [Burkholderia vietnamiensis]GBH24565.1 hypothetical protein BvRS1_16140 [Burkholderia vietnamiensis]
MEGLQQLDFGKQPTGEGGDTYRDAAKKIQANFDAISAAMDTKADAGNSASSLADEVAARIKGDADTTAAANARMDARDATVTANANKYADQVGAARLADAKVYADAQDVKVASAANVRMDAGDGNVTKAANTRMDSGDAATLASASTRMDMGDANTLASAKSYADAQDTKAAAAANTRMDLGDTNTLAAGKTYADGVGAARLTDAKAYSDTAKAAAISSANSYTDTKAAAAQSAAVASAKTYTDGQISALVGGAPEAMNTLKELADALNDDKDFAATTAAQIALKADTTYVDSKDAATLAAAKAYTDAAPAAGVQKSYVDTAAANALSSAKGYTDTVAGGVLRPASVVSKGAITGTSTQGALTASNGGGTAQTSIVLSRDGAPTDQKRWEIIQDGVGKFTLRTVNDAYSSANEAFTIIRSAAGVGVDQMRLMQSGGRVMVGTGADDGANVLQVAGTARAANFVINDQSVNASGLIGMNSGANGPNIAFYGANTAGSGALTFSAGGNEKMRLTAGGSLLVGTSAPAAGPSALVVGGAVTVYSATNDTVASISAGAYSGGLSIEAFDGANKTKKNIVLAGWGGRVLVGNNVADDGSAAFQVQGDARVSGNLTVSKSGGGARVDDPVGTSHSNYYLYKQGVVAWGVRGAWNDNDKFQINAYDTTTGVVAPSFSIARGTQTVSALKRLTVNGAPDDGSTAVQVNGGASFTSTLYLTAAQAGIELGSQTAVGSGYLDFHTAGAVSDYDARIIASGGDAGKANAQIQHIGGKHIFQVAGKGTSLYINEAGRTQIGPVAGDNGSQLQVKGDASVAGTLRADAAYITTLFGNEAVGMVGTGNVGMLMNNTKAGVQFNVYTGPGGNFNVIKEGAGTAAIQVTGSGQRTLIGGASDDGGSVFQVQGQSSMRGRVYLTDGAGVNGHAGEIAFKRNGDDLCFYQRAWPDTGNAGVQWVNAAYNAVVASIDNVGTLWLGGRLTFQNGSTLNGDGNLFMTWRQRWLSDDMAKLDDAWSKANDAQVNRADRGAQCHQVDRIEWDYVGSVNSVIHGLVDVGDPWVVTGLRVNASTSGITAIWQRTSWLRNN